MNHAPSTFLALCLTLAVGFTLSLGCCGPMWRPGCATGCGPTCGDGCGSCGGCGELYVDPWINEPADCCDPCDSCGNFNGQSCGKCRPVFAGVKSLWGYRCVDNCDSGCDSGCDAAIGGGGCGCGDGSHGAGIIHQGPVYDNYPAAGDGSYELGPGESLIDPNLNTSAKSSARPRTSQRGTPVQVVSQHRKAPRPGDARQIFQPRRLNEARPLAY